MIIINIYLIILNLISFISFGVDKYQAIKHKKRISEFHLITLTIFGGSIGTLLGMIIFKHKIRKQKFIITTLLSIIFHIFMYIKL